MKLARCFLGVGLTALACGTASSGPSSDDPSGMGGSGAQGIGGQGGAFPPDGSGGEGGGNCDGCGGGAGSNAGLRRFDLGAATHFVVDEELQAYVADASGRRLSKLDLISGEVEWSLGVGSVTWLALTTGEDEQELIFASRVAGDPTTLSMITTAGTSPSYLWSRELPVNYSFAYGILQDDSIGVAGHWEEYSFVEDTGEYALFDYESAIHVSRYAPNGDTLEQMELDPWRSSTAVDGGDYEDTSSYFSLLHVDPLGRILSLDANSVSDGRVGQYGLLGKDLSELWSNLAFVDLAGGNYESWISPRPDGSYLSTWAYSDGRDIVLRTWDGETGEITAEFEGEEEKAYFAEELLIWYGYQGPSTYRRPKEWCYLSDALEELWCEASPDDFTPDQVARSAGYIHVAGRNDDDQLVIRSVPESVASK